jgi:zinc protease
MPASAPPSQVVTLTSAAPMMDLKIMVRTGSANDPAGKEGLANLVARAMIEGGFGDPKNPTTKERLAAITRPWGDAAMPTVLVDKEVTTFSMTVPRDAFAPYMTRVLRPMLREPLFLPAEVERLRREALVRIQSGLRFEQQEMLGLLALDNWVFAGTPLQHLAAGTVKGLQAITPDDMRTFYRAHYSGNNTHIAAAISPSGGQQELASLQQLIAQAAETGSARQDAGATRGATAPAIQGREVLIITQPNAIATGLHLGFPIGVNRGDPDYWPLFVGNAFLGTHRDEFGRLYQEIRQDRGYNYGDYSYIEYYVGRPNFMFPPPGTPRSSQYFSMWIRPVAHQYAHFIMKVMTAELERFIRQGLTPQQVADAKIKARTLYLNYAESKGRQLGYGLDDAFYGISGHGYLPTMLADIDAVTPEQVNNAIRRHLQVTNLKYVIVTNESEGEKLANDIAGGTNVVSKTPEEYHLSEPIPPEKQQMLAQDKEWATYPLKIARENIHVVKAEQMFETAAVPGGIVATPAPPAK